MLDFQNFWITDVLSLDSIYAVYIVIKLLQFLISLSIQIRSLTFLSFINAIFLWTSNHMYNFRISVMMNCSYIIISMLLFCYNIFIYP